MSVYFCLKFRSPMSNRYHSLIASLFTLVALFANTEKVFGQTGSIAGQITDAQSGETLIGVTIYLEAQGTGTTTDFDGNFQLDNIPVGSVDIKISYVSYQEQLITGVQITDGGVARLDITMRETVFELDSAVVIQAKRIDNTENALLAQQKKADGVQDAISSQEMKTLGSNNAAASLTKVTGVSAVDGKYIVVRGLGDRYSTAQLNGQSMASTDPYRNSSQMDMIPSNLLDNIVASKTFTPDLPGNFTGGNVNIKTKSFPEAFTLRIAGNTAFNSQSSLQSNFASMRTGGTDWLGYDDGSRQIPTILTDPSVTEQLTTGFYITARNDEELAQLLNDASQALNSEMAPTTKTAPLDHGFSFSLGNSTKLAGKQFGYLLGVNYRRNYRFYDNGMRGGWELTDPGAEGLTKRFLFNDLRGVENPNLGGMLNLAWKPTKAGEISLNLIYNHAAEKLARIQEGEYPGALSNTLATFQTRTLSFRERELATAQLAGKQAFNDIRLEWSLGYTMSSQDEPDLRYFANSVVNQTAFSINAAEYDLPYHFWRTLADEEYQGRIDLTIPFAQSGSKSNKVKIGGAYRNKTREFREERFQFLQRDGEDYAGDAQAYFGADNTGIIGFDEDRGRYIFGNYITDDSQESNDYDGTEEVGAIYAMATYVIGRVKLTGGARVETTNLSAASLDTSVASGLINEADLLPSLNLSYALTDNMNFRASATRTLARPNMREIAPFFSFDQIGGDLVRGNANLERTLIDNFDVRWEWFVRPGELVAVSGYYKRFTNPIVQVYVPGAANPERTWQNVDEAKVAGVELEFRKDLGFIAPVFNNFRFTSNFSWIWSRVDVDPVEYEQNVAINPELKPYRPFQGQSPYLLNANLVYSADSLGLQASLAFNIFGDRLNAVSLRGTPDIYEQARPTLDLRLSKRIAERYSLTFTARNLLDANYRNVMSYNDQEFVVSEFRIGRTFGLGFSYTIN